MLKKYWVELFVLVLLIMSMSGLVSVWKPVFYTFSGVMMLAMIACWIVKGKN